MLEQLTTVWKDKLKSRNQMKFFSERGFWMDAC